VQACFMDLPTVAETEGALRQPVSNGQSVDDPSSMYSVHQIGEESFPEDEPIIDQVPDEAVSYSVHQSPTMIAGNGMPAEDTWGPGSKQSEQLMSSGGFTFTHTPREHEPTADSSSWTSSMGIDPLNDVLAWMEFADEAALADADAVESRKGSGTIFTVRKSRLQSSATEHSPEKEDTTVSSDDEDARPCPPPLATQVTLMHPEVAHASTAPASFNGQELRHPSTDAPQLPPPRNASITHCSPRPVADEVIVDKKEEEWLARKRLTGAIGRMVLYRAGEEPFEDLLGLSRTPHGRLKVTALRPGGKASMMGVEVGDQLISIDGQRPSERVEAETVRRCLESPTKLVFLGFAGKLHAEVRVRQPDQPRCGLPAFEDVTMTVQRHDGIHSSRHVSLCDPVFFQQASTSLLLEVAPQKHGAEPCRAVRSTSVPPVATDSVAVAGADVGSGPMLGDVNDASTPREGELASSHQAGVYCKQNGDMLPRTPSRIYELQRDDARKLLKRALREKGSSSAIE